MGVVGERTGAQGSMERGRVHGGRWREDECMGVDGERTSAWGSMERGRVHRGRRREDSEENDLDEEMNQFLRVADDVGELACDDLIFVHLRCDAGFNTVRTHLLSLGRDAELRVVVARHTLG
jgi:hypothetical protein